jgi:hypothetical protein
VRHQHGVLRKGVEGRQHLVDGGWPATISGVMPWIGMPAAGMSRCGSTSCSKLSCRAQLAVDDARGADLDDLVALAGSRPVVSVSNTV